MGVGVVRGRVCARGSGSSTASATCGGVIGRARRPGRNALCQRYPTHKSHGNTRVCQWPPTPMARRLGAALCPAGVRGNVPRRDGALGVFCRASNRNRTAVRSSSLPCVSRSSRRRNRRRRSGRSVSRGGWVSREQAPCKASMAASCVVRRVALLAPKAKWEQYRFS